jgi:hypothetical protein
VGVGAIGLSEFDTRLEEILGEATRSTPGQLN